MSHAGLVLAAAIAGLLAIFALVAAVELNAELRRNGWIQARRRIPEPVQSLWLAPMAATFIGAMFVLALLGPR